METRTCEQRTLNKIRSWKNNDVYLIRGSIESTQLQEVIFLTFYDRVIFFLVVSGFSQPRHQFRLLKRQPEYQRTECHHHSSTYPAIQHSYEQYSLKYIPIISVSQ